ncbi:MAG: cytochrome c biogenesis protein CcmG/thiol:disulfide interchange protein DsbE [Colwellia sp.]|jgi:cytochrome c biogenesis protein CcmG/thiol:disulfide interchange protein DsbE|uniref:DsbE family thiol:disulfide interchange protein n=1 Tax=Colwellia sp. BRX10-4 TaxID=2759843 RepID=UPI0015F3BE7E|nr:DsbE family thiol:disulfide interchange protein [Colwellia sp. BRX10-4]MBA6398546.1 DsbE family thiol:disulfide interchange protein [Colwellia sp. BRX10-4]
MGKLIRLIPLILFIALGAILFRGLSLNPTELPSALIGKKFPEFSLHSVLNADRTVTTADFKPGIKLVNVWGTWCPSCRYEHEYLNELSKTNRFTIYGLNYDDQRVDAAKWLTELGNPYQFSAFDEEGKLSVNLGVYAAPETFVVDHSNIIRKRYAGPLTPQVWQNEFEPLITQIEAEFLVSSTSKGSQ